MRRLNLRSSPDVSGGVNVVADGNFERFFRDEHTRVLRLAIAWSGDHQLARDITQETFLRAYREWSHVSTLDVPRAWLRRVTVNLLIDSHRRRRRERSALERHGTGTTTVSFSDPAATDWWDAVRRLPDRQRAVVALYYLDDHSIVEVAAVLGIAEGTVKSTLAQARKALARTLSIEEVG
jgi:RNA polymerase sigma-70 factor, ECF subfamily